MGARREVVSAVVGRCRSAGRTEKGRILKELCAVTGWHHKHAVRVLAGDDADKARVTRQRRRTYGASVKDALIALWEASDRICGKRLVAMIPALLPALERHGRPKLSKTDRALVLAASAATIDRLLSEAKIAAAGGKRRRPGFSSAVRREVPVSTFNDWHDPPPGFCEIDLVAHGGTSVDGSFIQTMTMVDVATGWTECIPLLVREGRLVVQAIERRQSLLRLILGADFDNDSAFMNDVVVPWCRTRNIEVTRSRAYKKNDQAFVEAEERRGRASPCRLRSVRGHRGRPRVGAPLCGGPVARELLPSILQAKGEAAGRGESDQALSCAGYALRTRACASGTCQVGQASTARGISQPRSYRAAGRDLRGAGRAWRTR
jgi:hypothetical protein